VRVFIFLASPFLTPTPTSPNTRHLGLPTDNPTIASSVVVLSLLPDDRNEA